MKKIIFIVVMSVFDQLYGQKESHLYLDNFNKNEIPEVPKDISKNSSLDKVMHAIYRHRKKSVNIDTTGHTYKIGKRNTHGLWFNSHYSSKYEQYDICEQFGLDVYNSGNNYNQNVYYDYDEENKLRSVVNEYTLKYKEKLFELKTETKIDYSAKGLELKSGKAFLFSEFEAGNWQIFNNDGKIINELNFDEKFNLTFIDVFNISKDLFYFLDLGSDEITLERSFNGRDAYWICRLQTADCFRAIIINDKTRELIYENDPDTLKKYLFRDYEYKLIEEFLKDFY